jgi:NADPH-dependent 2,4-dienoyl-CoA reductase/sulfur reductase-like enzyme
MTHEFEVVVVGAGPAGIAAAVSAAEHGFRVALVDDNPSAGGQIWRASKGHAGPATGDGQTARRWRERLLSANITRLQGWSVFDQISSNALRAERGGQAAEFRFENLIIATGARERFLPFPGWTLPNVMGAGALQAMMKGGMPMHGKRVVIAGSGPLLLAVAAALQSGGAEIACICEQAPASRLAAFAFSMVAHPGKIAEGIRYRATTWNTPFHTSSWPVQAIGEERLQAVKLSIRGQSKMIACDYLACGFHLVPNIELAAMLGCNIENGAVAVDENQLTSLPNIYCAGEPTGVGGLELSLVEGEIAGLASAGQLEKARLLFPQRQKFADFATRLAHAFALRTELKELPDDKTLLCRCEDVAYGAVREHHSWRAAKLHTRCGMGPCQSRICGTAAEFLLGWNANSARPPVLPVQVSSLMSSQPDREAEYENTHAV